MALSPRIAQTPDTGHKDKPGPIQAQFDRLAREGAKAYQAFATYRDLPIPERSLATVSQRLGKSKSLCARWSAQFHWIDRVNAWDSQQDQIRRTRVAAEQEKMRERQAQNIRIASQALMAPMLALARRAQTTADAFATTSKAELARMACLAARELPRIHEEERTLTAKADDVTKQQQPLTITGAQFTWVQGRCTCGHAWDAHDQSDPTKPMSCTTEGCRCKHFEDQEGNS